MINVGKCPGCGNVLRNLHHEEADSKESLGATRVLRAITFSCPSCKTVVGAQVDPIAVKADGRQETVGQVAEMIGGLERKLDWLIQSLSR